MSDRMLVLESAERMQLLRALLWALLAWSEDARRGESRKNETHFAECDRLQNVIVDLLRERGAVGVPMIAATEACMRVVADTCADADSPAVSELAVIVHDFARRTRALFMTATA